MAKILVVDDEESIRYTFETFLSEEGHAVTTACDFDEGLALAGRSDFDVIFSDIILGGRTGMDLLREIRRKDPVCPVVMVTGFPSVETAAEAVRLGAFDYVSKPVEQQALLEVTGRALERRQALKAEEERRARSEAVLDNGADGMVTVDAELKIVEVNGAAERICGLSREQIGRDLKDTCAGCGAPCADTLRNTLARNESLRVDRFECRDCARAGVHAAGVLSLATYPLVDDAGAVSGAVMLVRGQRLHKPCGTQAFERRQLHHLIGHSEPMQRVYSLIQRLAGVETSVLITGESGTGKELVAQALHFLSARTRGPLVTVDCSTLSESLLESELFGHVKGAFTGAVSDRIGRFQRADGGVIFLDEIGDISPKVQASLLRVIQERQFERVGDSQPIKVNVRILAATNKDLQQKVRDGQFREDLYYRLKVVEVAMPPLRDRREDLAALVEHFIARFNEKNHKRIAGVSQSVESVFAGYRWPGNVRELMHVIEHACVMCAQEVITVGDLPPGLIVALQVGAPVSQTWEHVNERSIQQALGRTDGNKAKAARLLGIDRRTLYRRLEKSGFQGDGEALQLACGVA